MQSNFLFLFLLFFRMLTDNKFYIERVAIKTRKLCGEFSLSHRMGSRKYAEIFEAINKLLKSKF